MVPILRDYLLVIYLLDSVVRLARERVRDTVGRHGLNNEIRRL